MDSRQPVRGPVLSIFAIKNNLNRTEFKTSEDIMSGYIGDSDRKTRDCCLRLEVARKTSAHNVRNHATPNQGTHMNSACRAVARHNGSFLSSSDLSSSYIETFFKSR